MKIILTGATGFAGSELLEQCCKSTTIHAIVVLTRRPLEVSKQHSKVQTIIMKDFTVYTPEVVEQIADADACIWCLGGRDAEAEVAFPTAFVRAMTSRWSARVKPFRYIHCSGILAERDQTKPLWFLQEGRRAKGQAESMLLDFAQEPEQGELWQTYIMRPSMIMSKQPSVSSRILGLLLGYVKVDDLAKTAIVLARQGHSSPTLENNELAKLG